MPIRIAAALAILLSSTLPLGAATPYAPPGPRSASLTASPPEAMTGWVWPVPSVRIVRGYLAPAHAYGAGHRGLDLAAASGEQVRAPAGGAVAFVGTVVDRGVVTIDHGGGLVTTLEPVVDAPPPGTQVAAGDAVGLVDSGGHAAPGTVHFGVRLHGEYINPMLLLGGVPRAVLLPCC